MAPRVAVTFGSAIGGLDALIAADRTLVATGKLPQPFMNPNSCINMAGGKVSILTGATGPIASIITACATGSSSLILGAMFIAQGMADVAICGAVDFPLVEPIVAGFATMNGAYRPKEGEAPLPPGGGEPPLFPRPAGICRFGGGRLHRDRLPGLRRGPRPCLRHRTGRLGDDRRRLPRRGPQSRHGHPLHRREHPPCRHLSRGDRCGQRPRRLDEGRGPGRGRRPPGGLRGRVPPVSANKSQMGHAMGATSAIESILAIEGMRRGVLLPTINHRPDPAIDLDCVAEGARACRPGIRPEERLRFRRVQRMSCVSPRQLIFEVRVETSFPSRSGSFFDPAPPRFAATAKLAPDGAQTVAVADAPLRGQGAPKKSPNRASGNRFPGARGCRPPRWISRC